jgi:hypothetical protein
MKPFVFRGSVFGFRTSSNEAANWKTLSSFSPAIAVNSLSASIACARSKISPLREPHSHLPASANPLADRTKSCGLIFSESSCFETA